MRHKRKIKRTYLSGFTLLQNTFLVALGKVKFYPEMKKQQ